MHLHVGLCACMCLCPHLWAHTACTCPGAHVDVRLQPLAVIYFLSPYVIWGSNSEKKACPEVPLSLGPQLQFNLLICTN